MNSVRSFSDVTAAISTSWNALFRPSVATYEGFANDPQHTTGKAYSWMFSAALLSGLISEFMPGSDDTNPYSRVVVVLSYFALTTGMIHLLTKTLGGIGAYSKVAYTNAVFRAPLTIITPLLLRISFGNDLSLLMWSTLILIYEFVLTTIAVKAVHQIGWGRAIFTSLLTANPSCYAILLGRLLVV